MIVSKGATMRRLLAAIRMAVPAILVATAVASAQTLEDVCPNAIPGTGLVWGAVTDVDGEMMMPGASVSVFWLVDGEEQRLVGQTGANGGYAICHIPLSYPIELQAAFATMRGARTEATLTEEVTRLDLTLAASTMGPDDRLWFCVPDRQSVIYLRFSRLVRCEEEWKPLEQCPKTELGRISVQPIGAGSGVLREMIEQIVQEARRLGANAVVNISDGRAGTSFGAAQHLSNITAEAVRIDVDPLTC